MNKLGSPRREPSKIEKFWQILRIARALRNIAGKRENATAVFDIGEAAIQLNQSQLMVKRLLADPQSREIIRERREFRSAPLAELERLPLRSLGYQYAKFMRKNGLDPEYYRRPKGADDGSYILLRIRQTHDVWHVVAGYDTSPFGELQVQSFVLGQLYSPVSMVIVAFSIFYGIFWGPESYPAMIHGIFESWRRGSAAKPLFNYSFENSWSMDLEQIRGELGLPSQVGPEDQVDEGKEISR